MTSALMELAANIKIGHNEATAYPWWCVVAKNHLGALSILAGPFFSRDRAEAHRQARIYEYGHGSIVYCFSGHNSEHYRDLIDSAMKATVSE